MSIWTGVLRTLVVSFVKYRRSHRDGAAVADLKARLKTEGKARVAGRFAGRALKRFRDL